MNLRIVIFVIIILLIQSCSLPQPRGKRKVKPKPAAVVPLPVLVYEDTLNHAFVFSNKIAGFYVGHSRAKNSSSHEGWTVNEKHHLLDYTLFVNNKEVERKNLFQFRYLPYGFERRYPQGVSEKFFLADSLDILIVQIEGASNISVQARLHNKSVRINKSHPRVSSIANGDTVNIYFKQVKEKISRTWFVLNNSVSEEELTDATYKKLLKNAKQKVSHKYLISDNKKIEKAALWSGYAMDALVTRQRGPGIWAGLPWFNNYWGRDTFISFAGALLINGKFEAAKSILQNFAGFQETDQTSREYGRIPNRITNNEVIYNTADGTWWFIRELYEYYLYSGDTELLVQLFPVVERAINGALRLRCDDSFFLKHQDAETWMDAKGADGAWSPRGNRAVEIQALWYTALQLGAKMAALTGANQDLTENWLNITRKLKKSFNRKYWDKQRECLYDHLNTDDSADSTLRPNQIFTVTVPDLYEVEPLLSKYRQESVAQTVVEKLTLPYGVLSLYHKDRNFHPYHHYQPYYPQDAAYHNGMIWTWLAGPVYSAMSKFNQLKIAGDFILNEANQIMNYDAIANYSELLEPVIRPGEKQPAISGTISQAWNLAEFRRNIYQDIIGYRPAAGDSLILFKPRLPKHIFSIKTEVPYKNGYINVEITARDRTVDIKLQSRINEKIYGKLLCADKMSAVKFILQDSASAFQYSHIRKPLPDIPQSKMKQEWVFTSIEKGRKYAVISEPGYSILKPDQVYLPLGESGYTVLFKRDVLEDDRGYNGKYVYPQDQAFKDGIFDLKSFTVYDMQQDWGFRINLRQLADPGWHPEYGFQLTFLAIAIQSDSVEGALQRNVGRGAFYSLSEKRAFNRIIYVGGGFEIQDVSGERLAQYVPTQKEFPIGFINEKQIRFKLPKKYAPGLSSKTIITILCGAQDDHGGAGIGDFRVVRQKAGQWHGGGAGSDVDGNSVYDVLLIN